MLKVLNSLFFEECSLSEFGFKGHLFGFRGHFYELFRVLLKSQSLLYDLLVLVIFGSADEGVIV